MIMSAYCDEIEIADLQTVAERHFHPGSWLFGWISVISREISDQSTCRWG